MVRIEIVGHAVGDDRTRLVRIGRGSHGTAATQKIGRDGAFWPADARSLPAEESCRVTAPNLFQGK